MARREKITFVCAEAQLESTRREQEIMSTRKVVIKNRSNRKPLASQCSK
jgi:hypothetical protein